MFHFPDSETGYYEDENSFFAHDREVELAAQEREDRFEAQAEEMQARIWEGESVLDKAPDSRVDFGLELSTSHLGDQTDAQCQIWPPPERGRIVMAAISVYVLLGAEDPVDPETGCTAAEIKEEEFDWVQARRTVAGELPPMCSDGKGAKS